MIDLPEQERAEDGRVRIGATAASADGAVAVEPSLYRARLDPEGEVSTPDEC